MTTACPACLSGRSRAAMTVRGFRFRRCRECRSLFIANPPSEEALASLYRGERYFANPHFGSASRGDVHGYRDYVADREHIEAKFDGLLARLERYAKPGELLDVGAGPGFLLSVAERRGWSGTGVELNSWAVAYARERLEVDVRTGAFGASPLEDGRFQAVTMMDLLEHVRSPGEAIAEAARVTRRGGLIAVLTPDAGSLVSRLMGARWPEVVRAPAHLVLFSVRGLASLLGRQGYAVLEWHSTGKTSRAATLLADASPAAPRAARLLRPLVARGPLADQVVTVDPRTKFCLYARLRDRAGAGRMEAYVPGRPRQAILSRSR